MSINRVVVVLPVLAGLMLTGTAVARMMPVQSVRDSVYGLRDSAVQTCAHNGVHVNKQGHTNCGLHKGWTDQGSTDGSEPGDQGDDQGGTQSSGDTGTSHGAGHEHHAQPAHTQGGHGQHGHSHGTTEHGHSGHAGHASSHGHGRGHSKG
jgi:hypothetical protein